jgi:hypothetical protein
MLEIVRGRPWVVTHTVYDNEGGPLTDLTEFASFACQIREKTATRNRKGFFEHALVADVTVQVDTSNSVILLFLPVTTVDTLHTGDYLIDLVAVLPSGNTEALLVPEPVSVVNRPSLPSGLPPEVISPALPDGIPDFDAMFDEALED